EGLNGRHRPRTWSPGPNSGPSGTRSLHAPAQRQRSPPGARGRVDSAFVETRTVRTRLPVDLGLTLGRLQHGGRRDPCVRVHGDEVWRATDTPAGPATLNLRSVDAHTIAARAWGPGAGYALDDVPALVGADDDPPPLAGVHPLVTELERRLPGLRVGRTGAVM